MLIGFRHSERKRRHAGNDDGEKLHISGNLVVRGGCNFVGLEESVMRREDKVSGFACVRTCVTGTP
jgi:hypothetical protein